MEIVIIIIVILLVYFLLIKKKKIEKIKENTDVKFFYTDFELGIVEEVNKYRKSLNLQEVKLSNYISQICLEHNNYMIKINKVSHDNFQERSDRIIYNLEADSVGENLAFNFSTPKATLYAWLQSPTHKENLEKPNWNIMGVSNLYKYTTNIFAEIKN